MKKDFSKIFQIAVVFIGTIVGAGLASGKEITQFFTSFGLTSFFGILFCGAFYILKGSIIAKISIKYSLNSYSDVLKIISPKFVSEFENKIMNIHPALIPSFCGDGFYGEKVHQAVIDYGAKVSGATVHFVNEKADAGPIIMQDTVKVMDDDDAKTLAKRVLEVEHTILPRCVKLFCEGKISVEGRRVRIK